MALNGDAVLTPTEIHVYMAAVGTEVPADVRKPGSGWTEVGHTDYENLMDLGSEGGESTVHRSAQSAALRSTNSPLIEYMELNLLQFDEESRKLYYGSNAKVIKGRLTAPSIPSPTKCAALVVVSDAEGTFSIHDTHADIGRASSGNIDLSTPEELASLPLRVTFLQKQGTDYTYTTAYQAHSGEDAGGLGG